MILKNTSQYRWSIGYSNRIGMSMSCSYFDVLFLVVQPLNSLLHKNWLTAANPMGRAMMSRCLASVAIFKIIEKLSNFDACRIIGAIELDVLEKQYVNTSPMWVWVKGNYKGFFRQRFLASSHNNAISRVIWSVLWSFLTLSRLLSIQLPFFRH